MNYYEKIKEELIDNEINKRIKTYSINKSDLRAYYNVGKMLSEAGKHYGERIIKEYSIKLSKELNKKYSVRILYKMVKYFNFMSNVKVPTLSAKLSWSRYDELLKYRDFNKINYYISIIESDNLSVRQLRERIKSNEYERLPEATKKTIKHNKINNISLVDYVKNPIMIKSDSIEFVTEKVLQKLILENIPSFLKELGSGFTFVENEYPIKLGGRYNYIDLLLFNINFNCYVVTELKVTELKKEHVGQIQIYMNYINQNVKSINQERTIGIIICKEDNKYIIKYCSDNRIISRVYELV